MLNLKCFLYQKEWGKYIGQYVTHIAFQNNNNKNAELHFWIQTWTIYVTQSSRIYCDWVPSGGETDCLWSILIQSLAPYTIPRDLQCIRK